MTFLAIAIDSDVIQFSLRNYGTRFQGDAGALLEEGKLRKGAGLGLLGLRRLIDAPGQRDCRSIARGMPL